jgi:hypothetical protein
MGQKVKIITTNARCWKFIFSFGRQRGAIYGRVKSNDMCTFIRPFKDSLLLHITSFGQSTLLDFVSFFLHMDIFDPFLSEWAVKIFSLILILELYFFYLLLW